MEGWVTLKQCIPCSQHTPHIPNMHSTQTHAHLCAHYTHVRINPHTPDTHIPPNTSTLTLDRAKMGKAPGPMPRWLGNILAWILTRIGPKGLEFGRYSLDYHYLRNYLYVQRHMGEARAGRHVPSFVKKIVEEYDGKDGTVSKRYGGGFGWGEGEYEVYCIHVLYMHGVVFIMSVHVSQSTQVGYAVHRAPTKGPPKKGPCSIVHDSNLFFGTRSLSCVCVCASCSVCTMDMMMICGACLLLHWSESHCCVCALCTACVFLGCMCLPQAGTLNFEV